MDRAVVGIILAQYGISQPGGYRVSLVHAFGHGLRHVFDLQQGLAHAVIVPHALRALFDSVDAQRDLLAEGLLTGEREAEPAGDDDTASAVVDAVTAVRDGLELPTRLRDLEGTSEDGLRRVAKITHRDGFMANRPPGFEPTVDDLEAVLRAAW
jgi:alcohol dehydrogenase class IV